MSTKNKVILGFLLQVAIIITISFLSVSNTKTTQQNFADYQRIAKLDAHLSDISANMNLAGYYITFYGKGYDPENLKLAYKATDTTTDIIKQSLPLIFLENRRQALNAWLGYIENYKGLFGTYSQAIVAAKDTYDKRIEPANLAIMAEFNSLDESLQSADTALRQRLLVLRTNLNQFTRDVAEYAYGQLPSQRAGLAATKETLDKSLANFSSGLTADQKESFSGFFSKISAFEALITDNLYASLDKADKAWSDMGAIETKIFADIDQINSEISAQSAELGQKTDAANEAGRAQATTLGGVGVLLGLAAAAYIIMGLVRTLGKLAGYARSVAEGQFNVRMDITEPGEVGDVAQAVSRIPQVLANVTTEYAQLSQSITSGNLRQTVDATRFSGDYATLVRGTNSIVESLGAVLDLLPSPITIYDSKYMIAYANRAYQNTFGTDVAGKPCPDVLRIPLESNTAGKSLEHAMPTKNGAAVHMAISVSPTKDATGRTIGAVSVLSDISDIKSAQQLMLTVANEANALSERMASASEELSAQVEQVSRGAETQRMQVSSTAAAMEEMNSTVLSVASSAANAREQSDATRNKAQAGSTVVQKVVGSITHVNTLAGALQKDMLELGEQADSIGGVLNVISDIADQTNLLALNAAIEAARAGEAGRGFAVVADEVRKLAEKTMSATSEVGQKIRAIQQAASKNIGNVEQAARSVTEATGLADESGHVLEEIVKLANDCSMLITTIATAAEQQSATSDEITRAVSSINQITVETSDGMAQSSEAVHDLAQVAVELKNTLSKLSKA